MSEITKVIQVLTTYYSNYGYWILFFGAFLENTLYTGILVPGLIILLLAGYYAEQGILSLPISFIAGFAGMTIGDNLGYWIGYHGWQKLILKRKFANYVEKYKTPLLSRAGKFIVIAHFSPYLRSLAPTVAGIIRVPYRLWLAYDAIGAVCFCGCFLLFGYLGSVCHQRLESLFSHIHYVEAFILLALVSWIIRVYLKRSRKKRQE